MVRLKGKERADRLGRALVCLLRGWLLLTALLFGFLQEHSAWAQAAAPQPKLSKYEEESVALALRQVKGEREPNPEGKRVESIEVVPLDMIDDRDPWPNFLNVFHYTSRRYVITREVLLKQGQPFVLGAADETERNLRGMSQFSVALVVPLKGSTPDSVRVLVVTKDVLSLRVNSDPRFYNGSLYYLALYPSESNLLGTHHGIGGNVVFTSYTYQLGGNLSFPRIAGSGINASIGAAAVFNCESKKIEGSNGSFSYGKPLLSTESRWAWQTSLAWSNSIAHSAPGTAVDPICSGRKEASIRVVDEQHQAVTIPYRYEVNAVSGSASLTRSFGTLDKYDLTVGAEANRSSDHANEPAAAEVMYQLQVPDSDGMGDDEDGSAEWDYKQRTPSDPASELASALNAFESSLPTPYATIDPFIHLHAYRNAYHRMLNYWTLGLQEDQQLGHSAVIKVYPALKAWGSSRNLFGTFASLGYTWPVQTGFFRAVATSSTEFSAPGQTYAAFASAAHFVTPQLGFGRFVYDARFTRQYINDLNARLYLGGTDRLRGYRAGAFNGANSVVGNIEFRTVPLQALSVLVGGALFYDVGDAFDTMNQFKLRDGAGVGLRLGFPQLQSDVLRIDVGFPLLPDDEQGEMTVVAVFGQAVNAP